MQPILNHIGQSTLFVAAAWLLTLTLRKNRAQARYWVWLAASVKFALPFSMLVWLGSQVSWRTAPVTPQSMPIVTMERPVRLIEAPAARATVSHVGMPELLLFIWACGFVAVMARWGRRWSRMRAEVRASRALDIEFPVPVKSSTALREPGVFGVFRPVLLLPEGIVETLPPAQLKTVLAHELCHVRRRDNLAMAIHAAIQATFWFHPLVWWIGAKLIEERERACDEEVLRGGSDPETYAEGILNVCKLYLAAPSECVAGVTGSNLNRRIEEIMTNRLKPGLSAGKKLLLAASGMLAMAAPIAIGLMDAPRIRAQAPASAEHPTFDVVSVKELKNPTLVDLHIPDFSGNRFTSKAPLVSVIAAAYGLTALDPSKRLTGIPDWAGFPDGIYSIEATATIPPGLSSSARDERVRRMLQALLADRFKMVIRRDSKEMPVYEITVAKGGPKLQKAAILEKDCGAAANDGQIPCHQFNGGQGRGLHSRAATVDDMTGWVENWTDRPLVNKTGIEGLYKIETDPWLPMNMMAKGAPDGAKGEAGVDLADLPTIFQIFERLGLRMEPANDKVDVYVVEHLERPTEN